MLQALLLVVLPVFAADAPKAKEGKVTGVEIVAKGVFKTVAGGVSPNEGAALGVVAEIRSEKFIQATDEITAKPGLSFGLRFKILGKPKDAPVTLTAVTVFPKPGILDPRSNRRVPKEMIDQEYRIGVVAYHGYEFTFPWEIVEGTWAFELWQGKKRLSRQEFTVEKDR